MELLPNVKFQRLKVVQVEPHVACVELARPEKSNAFDDVLWGEFPQAIDALDAAASANGIRVVIIAGQGNNFCAGIDLKYLSNMFETLQKVSCPGRMRENFRRHILGMQDCFNSLERCRLPVIAAVHGCCVGGGVDLISACDIRVCSAAAIFCVREVDVGIVADLGTLQRLPKIIGFGPAAELALTARTIDSQRALQLGLVTQVFPGGRDELLAEATRLAKQLAAKSPLAMAGTKRILQQARDVPVRDGLDYVALWNSAQLMSDDIAAVLAALASRSAPRFSRL